MGLWRYCHSCLAAPAYAYGSIFVCGGGNAISGKKILGCAYAWPHLQIHDSGLPGSALRSANNRVHRRTRAPLGSGAPLVSDRHCVGGLLLLGWEKRQKAGVEIKIVHEVGNCFTTGCV